MFSSKSLSTRLTLSYGLLHVIITLMVVTATYYLISSSLKNKDHEILESEAKEYEYQFKTFGLPGIKEELQSNQAGYQDIGLYAALLDREHSILETNIETKDLELALIESLKHSKHNRVEEFVYEGLSFDILHIYLNDDFALHLLIRSKNRTELISSIKVILIVMFSLSLVLSILIGREVSKKNLKPIEDLAETIKQIEGGSFHSRVEIGKYEDELARLGVYFNKMIDQVEKTLNGMKGAIDSISHDLRTPLTRLKILLELSLKNSNSVDELRASSEHALEITNDIEGLINTLLDLSQAESGILKLTPQKLSLRDLIAEVIELYEFVIEDNQLDVKVEVSDEVIYGDYHRLKQVFANLLDNAIKYSRTNGEIKISAITTTDNIEILVQDNGIGLSPKSIDRIWDRFYREDQSRHKPGLGLGLSLVRSIVMAHGGSVAALTDREGLTTFKVILKKMGH